MATIAEIREKYPQYSDMPDAALADALHSKFYADMPKTDFYTKIGLSSQYGSAVPSATPVRQDAIPSARAPSRGALDYIAGIPETAVTAGFGMLKGAVAPFAAVAGEYLGGVNTPQGRAQGARFGKNVESALTYTPQTQTAKDIINYAGEKLQGIDLNAIPFAQGSTVAALAPAAAKQLPSVIKNEATYLKNAVGEIPSVKAAREKTAATNIANSYENAARIEASDLAVNKYGLAIDPEVSNPSVGAKVRGAIVGERNVSNMMAEQNQPKVTAALKEEVGIPPTKVLNEVTFKEAHAAPAITQPYDKVKAIPSVQIGATTLDDLDAIKRGALIGEKSSDTLHIAQRLDNLKADVLAGGDGNRFLSSVQQLRKEAQDIYRKKDPLTPLERREANAIMSAADILENVLTDNLPVIKDRDAFLKARTAQAKLYQLEEATNLATGVPDPRVLAKMIDDKRPISGVARDIGLIAANFPDAVTPMGKGGLTFPRITRATLPGALGAMVGLPLGPAGSLVGAAVGTGIGEITKRVMAKNMLTPEFQARNAVAPDYRPAPFPVNNLRPVTPGAQPAPNATNIVPFDPRNALVEPEIRPNFVFGKSEPLVDRADINPSSPFGPRQIGNDTPSDVIARRRAEDARQTRMAQIAEAETLAAESGGRAPAREGINTLYELDPITKKLVPVDQSVRGSVDLGGVPSTLRSAVDKLSGQTSTYTPTITEKIKTGKFYTETSGGNVKGAPIYEYIERPGAPITERSTRAFDLTAPELAVWKNTRASLEQLDPRYKSLSDKEITNRMLDRKWIEDAVVKAREKSASFYQLAVRARDAERMGARADTARNMALAQQAEEASGQMKNTLDLLEDQLVKLRADDSRKRQGPKTQGAIRNNLTSNQNRNKLREE